MAATGGGGSNHRKRQRPPHQFGGAGLGITTVVQVANGDGERVVLCSARHADEGVVLPRKKEWAYGQAPTVVSHFGALLARVGK